MEQDFYEAPLGFFTFSTNAGLKEHALDLGVVVSEKVAEAAALFTQNKILGNPILVGREHLKKGRLKAVVVNSKNANVLSGTQGLEATHQLCRMVAQQLSCDPTEVLPSSTGVIGRPFPIKKILDALQGLPQRLESPPDFHRFAQAIMTTDTFPKLASRRIGQAVLVGVAKGSGMVEPHMATMLAYFFTDAQLPHSVLDSLLRRVVDKTFHCLSIDSDTSTSDTVALLANGLAGKVAELEFEQALLEVSTELTKKLALDAEGATKLFIVHVQEAPSFQEARAVGKAIINSPLVKTAIYQGDPNWGRIYMAIGKTQYPWIQPHKIKLSWGPTQKTWNLESDLSQLSQYLQRSEIELFVHLSAGSASATVYGCDLTEEYVKINAYYTT